MQSHHRSKNHPRFALGQRLFIGLAIIGLVVPIASRALAQTDADRPSYARFWEKKIKSAQGDRFIHATYRPRASVPPKVLKRAHEILQSQVGAAVRDGKLTIDREKQLAASIVSIHAYTGATLSDEVLDEFSDWAAGAFKEFLEYVGRPDLLPGLKFRLFEKQTKLEPPSKESAVMYLAWNRQFYMHGRVHYKGEKEAIHTTGMFQTDSVRGQLVGVFTGSFEKDSGVNLRSVPHHAYGGIGYSAISCYAIPMSELFPLCLRHIAAENVSKEITRAWIAKGRPNKFVHAEHKPIITKWDVREDSLVEALIDEFIGTKLDELGFTEEEWAHYCKHGGNTQYAHSPMLKRKIHEVGAPEVLRIYMEEPEKLFAKGEAHAVAAP